MRFSRFDVQEDRADLVHMRSAQLDILVDMPGAQIVVIERFANPFLDDSMSWFGRLVRLCRSEVGCCLQVRAVAPG